MKQNKTYNYLIFILLFGIGFGNSLFAQIDKTPVDWEIEQRNIGNMEAGDTLLLTFPFTNRTGNVMVNLKPVGDYDPNYSLVLPDRPISPMNAGLVTVKVHPVEKEGQLFLEVPVESEPGKIHLLTVTGMIIPEQ